MADSFPPQPPTKLAFIIDNEVVDVVAAPDRFAAILLSEPLVIDVSHLSVDNQTPHLHGKHYDPATGKFSDPA
jgi:hypothetical protein